MRRVYASGNVAASVGPLHAAERLRGTHARNPCQSLAAERYGRVLVQLEKGPSTRPLRVLVGHDR